MDLQNPEAKMSKSASGEAGIVYLLDDPAAIEKKFKRAVTDSGNEVAYDRATKPGVANLLEILAAATASTPEATASSYTQYGALKVQCKLVVARLRLKELQTVKLRVGVDDSAPAVNAHNYHYCLFTFVLILGGI